MKKLSKNIVRTLMIVGAMVMLMCIPVSAKTSTSVLAMKKGTTTTIKKTSKVTSSKKKVASTKKKSSTKYTITAKKAGKSTLKVYDKNGKLSQKVYLLVYSNKTLKYNTTAITLTKGGTKKVQATVPSGCTVKYASSNKNVAKVNANGKITAVAKGTATIKAQVYYKNTKIKTFKKSVTVKNAASSGSSSSSSSYTLSKSSISIDRGKTATLQCKTNGTFNSDTTCEWSTSDSSVVGISRHREGNFVYSQYPEITLEAKNPGTATITCKVGGKSLTCKVTVANTFSNHVQYQPGNSVIDGGNTISFSIWCEKASDTVTYKLSNDNLEFSYADESEYKYDDYYETNAYRTYISFYGRRKGTCDVSIYINGKLFGTYTVTISSTDEIYYTYLEWKQNMKDEIWTDDMTDREKIGAVGSYIRQNCVYISDQSGYMGWAVYGGGNCIAAADLVIDIAHDLGLEAEEYLVNGTYAGHVYAIVYYEPGVGTKVDISFT